MPPTAVLCCIPTGCCVAVQLPVCDLLGNHRVFFCNLIMHPRIGSSIVQHWQHPYSSAHPAADIIRVFVMSLSDLSWGQRLGSAGAAAQKLGIPWFPDYPRECAPSLTPSPLPNAKCAKQVCCLLAYFDHAWLKF